MSRWVLRLISLISVGVGLWWFVPRHTQRMVTLDGQHSFSGEGVPKPRDVIWTPAIGVEPRAANAGARDSLIRPAIDENETVLYFTLRESKGGADIYRSRLVRNKWLTAEPVTELNTEFDDIGPVIQNGGKTLYLYSNREGGYGGFDLYVSHRVETGWSKPENLGPRINSPAHEYDPAILHDGTRLFFASNRSQRMHRLIVENELGDPREQWTTTLRADLGLNQFDLYDATRKSDEHEWHVARPLAELNLEASNEGAPFVDPAGAFVYFVSDRPFRDDEETNYDIYRSRIRTNDVGAIENLGSSVNTAANEIEPALSAEGFRLFFSRNQIGDQDSPADFEDKYSLFSSTASEVEFVGEWDTANWSALIAFVSDNWVWLLLILLLIALLGSLVWFFRRMTVKRASVPTFFLLALLLHMFLGLGAFLVTFDPILLAKVKSALDGLTASEDNTGSHQSHDAGEKSWEKLGDVQSRDAVEVPEVERQVTETPNVPIPTNQAFVNLPMKLNPNTPKVYVPSALPKPAPKRQKSEPQLTRNSRTQKLLQEKAVTLEDVKAIQQETVERPREEVKLAKNNPIPVTDSPQIPRRRTRVPVELAQDSIRPEQSPVETTVTTTADANLNRKAAAQPTAEPVAKVNIETVSKADRPMPNRPIDRPDIDVTKSQSSTAPNDVALPRRKQRVSPLEFAKVDINVKEISESVPNQSKSETANLDRARKALPTEDFKVQSDTVQRVVAASKSVPDRQNVVVNKASPPSPTTNAPMLRRKVNIDREFALAKVDIKTAPAEDVKISETTPTTAVDLNRTAASASAPERVRVNIDAVQAVRRAPPNPFRQTQNVQVDRKSVAPPANLVASIPRRAIRQALEFAEAKVEKQTSTDTPVETATSSPEVPLDRTNNVNISPSETDRVVAEAIQKTTGPKADMKPQLTNVQVNRQLTPLPDSPTNVSPLRRRTVSAASALQQIPLEVAASASDAPQSKSTTATVDLRRQLKPVATAVSEQVAGAEVKAIADAPNAPAKETADIELEKQLTGSVNLANPLTGRRSRVSTELAKLDIANISPIAGSISPIGPSSDRATANLDRKTAANSVPAGIESVATEALQKPGTAATPMQAPAQQLTLNRQSGPTALPNTGAVEQSSAAKSVRNSPRLAAEQSARQLESGAQPLKVGQEVVAEITRSTGDERPISEDQIQTSDGVAAIPSTPTVARNGLDVDLARLDTTLPSVPFKTDGEVSGPFRRTSRRLVLGSLSDRNVDVALAPSPFRSRLLERNAKAPMLYYAQDNIGLQAMLQLRQVTEEAKKDLIKAFGGKKGALEAVRRGIAWLATQQHEDGHWSLTKFRKVNGKTPNGQGNVNSDVAATGMALLPFLGNGNTHMAGKYKDNVAKGVEWLVKDQKPDGELTRGGEGNGRMYSHGIATIALCEAFAMTRDPKYQAPAQKAIDFIAKSQHKATGGWRYQPNQPADTSVVGWQVMALKSGQMAGLKVPKATLDGVRKWFKISGGTGTNLGRFGYTGKDFKIAMTAEGLLCLQYLGSERNDPRLEAGAEHLLRHLPKLGRDTSYYYYYGTQVMYHLQGQYWQQWNEAMSGTLINSQIKEGHMAGSWNPTDQWERSGGRIMSTSLRVLMLEVYFRHLPLYQVVGQP